MEHWTRLTRSGRALLITQVIRLLFGGYLAIQDQYLYHDTESAVTVLMIYILLGIFTAMFLFQKRGGLLGILGLSIILILFNTVFTLLALGGTIAAGMHDPLDNWWATVLRYVFFGFTLVFAIRVQRDTRDRSLAQ